jgi:hypothetical protein
MRGIGVASVTLSLRWPELNRAGLNAQVYARPSHEGSKMLTNLPSQRHLCHPGDASCRDFCRRGFTAWNQQRVKRWQ